MVFIDMGRFVDKISVSILVGILVVLLCVEFVVADSSWSFYRRLTDNQGDSGGPGYTDIVIVDYGFNETHFSVNITVRESINLGDNEMLWIGVLVDTDANPDTGYQGYGVGAEYYVEIWLTSSASGIGFYRYNGSGTSWEWQELTWVLYYEIGEKTASMIIEKGSIEFPRGEIRIAPVITYSTDGGKTSMVVDHLGPVLLPIPESILVSLSIGLVALTILYKVKKTLVPGDLL